MFKRISAVGVSCVTALVLMLSSIAAPSTASAVSLEEMANTAIECIMSHEGSYGSINPNDCGAVSVGKLQWHADRALTVMRRACQLDPEFAAATLGSTFYNEVMSASNWNYRTFSSSEKYAASALLSSDCGVQAQDAQAFEDVQGYIVTGQNKGITDAGALILYADIYNFGCGIAASVASKAASYAGSYSAVTLDDMYKGALNCSYSSNKAFVGRANSVYNYLCSIGLNSGTSVDDTQGETTTTTPAVQFTEDGAGTYTVAASQLNMRSGPGTGYSIVTTINNGEYVTVTETNGEWAAVEYNGFTGYCAMNYLVICAETTTETSETTTEALETTTETEATETTAVLTEETTTTTETTSEVSETETEETTTEITYETEVSDETTSTTEETEATSTEATADVIVNSSYASIYGDINSDGVVSVADAVLLHKYILGVVSLNMEQLANADCSFDSVITTKDVTVIMQHLSGHYTALPIL